MFAETPSANIDLSRSRLRHLTTWIRDDLDLKVAREGPDILRPDDVLTLHETFLALPHAAHITAMDLRATGIYKAVQDISGVATRWPGQLCDDCDKIISLWTTRFGPLNDLHPFLFGRGGRLESIATVTDYSKEAGLGTALALLNRWHETCPDKIHPKRSHRLGNLGFRAGAWWINPLFAYHAGIIGLEAVEGGTTHDKYGAYALVLKDTGELEASSEECFTYRVPQNDKGRFRLTSATSKSRDSIRVLRSHSINSVWGPKAGIRYEGLYAVKGWSIRQAKHNDTSGGEWSEGDIIFEVKFERKDIVPIEEVNKRPTATEVDDYSEYKRLRRMHREIKRSGLTGYPFKTDLHRATKAAPPIRPLQTPPIAVATPKSLIKFSSRPPSNKTTFKRPRFDVPEEHHMETPDVVSPMTVLDMELNPFTWDKNSKLKVPTQVQNTPELPSNDLHRIMSTGSTTSSSHTAITTASNIREVAPWIDFDAELALPSLPNGHPIVHEQIISQVISSRSTTSFKKDTANSAQPTTKDIPSLGSTLHGRRKSSDLKKESLHLGAPALKKADGRKSIFVRSRNPMAKLFDGANDEADDFGDAAKPTTSSMPRHTSSDDSMHVHSPIPIRPFSPESPFAAGRRNTIFFENKFMSVPLSTLIKQFDSVALSHAGDVNQFSPSPSKSSNEVISSLSLPSSEDPFIDALFSPSNRSFAPLALMKFISQPRAATPISIPTSTHVPERLMELDNEDSMVTTRLRKMVQGEFLFQNPFTIHLPRVVGGRRKSSRGVAPITV